MLPLNIQFQAKVWSVFTYKFVRRNSRRFPSFTSLSAVRESLNVSKKDFLVTILGSQ